MQRLIDGIAEGARTIYDRGEAVGIILRGQRWRRLAIVWGVPVALLLLAVGWGLYGWARPGGEPDGAGHRRYLLICGSCGERAFRAAHPAGELERRGAVLCCPACGSFAAACYRRGGQVLPPGGWSEAVSGRRVDEVEAGSGGSGS
jgi:hypothetical protein